MSSALVRHRSIISTVLGAGVFIGATGLYMLLRFLQKRKSKIVNEKFTKLDMTVSELQDEITALKKNPLLSSSRLSLRSNSSRSSRKRRSGLDTDDEMYSALGSESDEFYDITSDEEDFFSFSSSRSFQDHKPSADDENVLNLFEEVDLLLKGNDDDRSNALKLLFQEENLHHENARFLWRVAKAYQMQATACGAQKNLEKKKEFVNQGLAYAGKALAIDPSDPDAHKWYAILVGMQVEFLPVKDKIQNGYAFQEHLQQALEYKPNDSTLYHLLGRFKYEVANLSWIEKKMAAALFTALPAVTLEEALSDFKKAEELNPIPWKENRLFLAKCYIGCGRYDDAVEWLQNAKEISPETHDDRVCDEECETLLCKYKKHGNKMSLSF